MTTEPAWPEPELEMAATLSADLGSSVLNLARSRLIAMPVGFDTYIAIPQGLTSPLKVGQLITGKFRRN